MKIKNAANFVLLVLKKTISEVNQIRIINIKSSDVLQMEIESSSTFVKHEIVFSPICLRLPN